MTAVAVDARPALPLPSVWPGFVIAGLFFAVEIGELIIDPSRGEDHTPLSLLVAIGGAVYWYFCVYRIHQVLRDITGGTYPIGPWRAALLQLVPFFNFYWLVHWPNKLADFLKSSGIPMGRYWPGLTIIAGMFMLRLVDGSIGLAVVFGVLLYIRRRLARLVPA
ncbi:MAG TPA: hypothetical protein VF601_23870 [Beijerinckiaceae bacterium]|jgi:hypothetical protein